MRFKMAKSSPNHCFKAFERCWENQCTSQFRHSGIGHVLMNCAISCFVDFPIGFWWFWYLTIVKITHFDDFSLVLLMFGETWISTFWSVFRPIDFSDFQVCDFVLFSFSFWLILVSWEGLKEPIFDSRRGFKAKVAVHDSVPWRPHFGRSATTEIMKFDKSEKA